MSSDGFYLLIHRYGGGYGIGHHYSGYNGGGYSYGGHGGGYGYDKAQLERSFSEDKDKCDDNRYGHLLQP